VNNSLVGRKLGKYKIQSLLGQGGMATVYKGYQEEIDRFVAIKVLPPHPGLDQQFIDRFKLEARTIARLQHPHILPLYDYGVQDDILYLVMAYVEGGSLSDRIQRGPLEPRDAERILRQVAAALDYAHRQGVIHRDIKPDNILMDTEGNALLADFGIVKIAESDSVLTGTGGMVGTPAYISPEQASGDVVSPAADVYSLGVVIWEMLTGARPYTADNPMQVLLKHINAPIPNLRDTAPHLPQALEVLMQRALAKSPQNRYQTATEMMEDFTRAIHSPESLAGLKLSYPLSPDPTAVAEPQPPTQAAPPQATTVVVQGGTNPLILLGGFAIIGIVLVIVVLAVLSGRDRTGEGQSPAATGTADAAATQIAAVPTPTPAPTFGRLSFSTTNSLADTVTLQVQNLKPVSGGLVYVAWLRNTRDNTTLKLGELTIDALGTGVLPPFTDPDGRPLATLFNAVFLSKDAKGVEQPSGEVSYSAQVPGELMDALTEIFIQSPDGLGRDVLENSGYNAGVSAGGPTAGLLVSALAEADIANQHAGLAQRSKDIGGLHLHAEHTINIVQGAKDDYDGDGRGENPGFGVGINRFTELIEKQLDKAANAPTSNRRLQSSLQLIRVCLENTRARAQRIIELEKKFLVATSVESVVQDADLSTTISANLINGTDQNGNGEVEAFEGECGLDQINTVGILIGTLNLVEGPLAK
jgi:serine/threonine-protein kinase